MDFQIRPYREADAPAIREIINDSILNTSHNYDYQPKTGEEVEQLFAEKICHGDETTKWINRDYAYGKQKWSDCL